MLLLINHYKYLVLHCEGEFESGQPMTIGDKEVARPAAQGDLVHGMAGEGSGGGSMFCSPRVTVYWDGEVATSFFDVGRQYRLLGEVYYDARGLLTPESFGFPPAGVVTKMPESFRSGVPGTRSTLAGDDLITIQLMRGGVIPKPAYMPEPARPALGLNLNPLFDRKQPR